MSTNLTPDGRTALGEVHARGGGDVACCLCDVRGVKTYRPGEVRYLTDKSTAAEASSSG